ncbi:hypothetical protein D3C81_1161360 [compost metagenome]
MGQDAVDEGLVWQALGEADNHGRAFLGEAEKSHFIAARGHRQRHAAQSRHRAIRLTGFVQDLQVHRKARPKVIANARAGGGICHPDNPGHAWQVIAATQLREHALYAAPDCVFHLIAISVPTRATEVTRSPWLMVAPGRRPGSAAITALWLPW